MAAFNEHFLHDIGAFQIGIGATLFAGLMWTDALFVALLGASVGAVLHEVAHIIDRDLGGKRQRPVVPGSRGRRGDDSIGGVRQTLLTASARRARGL